MTAAESGAFEGAAWLPTPEGRSPVPGASKLGRRNYSDGTSVWQLCNALASVKLLPEASQLLSPSLAVEPDFDRADGTAVGRNVWPVAGR